MTIEEKFFKAFGIEKQPIYLVMDLGKSHICDKATVLLNKHLFSYKSRRCYVKAVNWIYPEITAEKLLELICILNDLTSKLIELDSDNLEDLKKEILQMCISNYMLFRLPYKRKFIDKVHKLFEDE